MSDILVFDDMQERHNGFRHYLKGHGIKHAYDVNEAIEFMVLQECFTGKNFYCAFLDHDVGLESRTGHDLCIWLQRNPQFCPPRILIHSWNPSGAKHMEAVLLKISPTPYVVIRPYKAPK